MGAKKEINSLAAQNYEMNLANMEMSKMLENQNKDCLELINHLMRCSGPQPVEMFPVLASSSIK